DAQMAGPAGAGPLLHRGRVAGLQLPARHAGQGERRRRWLLRRRRSLRHAGPGTPVRHGRRHPARRHERRSAVLTVASVIARPEQAGRVFAALPGAPFTPFSLLRLPIVPCRSGPRTRTSGAPNFAAREERARARILLLRATKSAPPLAGSAGRLRDPRPGPL